MGKISENYTDQRCASRKYQQSTTQRFKRPKPGGWCTAVIQPSGGWDRRTASSFRPAGYLTLGVQGQPALPRETLSQNQQTPADTETAALRQSAPPRPAGGRAGEARRAPAGLASKQLLAWSPQGDRAAPEAQGQLEAGCGLGGAGWRGSPLCLVCESGLFHVTILLHPCIWLPEQPA